MQEITDAIDTLETKSEIMAFTMGICAGILNEDKFTSEQKLNKLQYVLGYSIGRLTHLPD